MTTRTVSRLSECETMLDAIARRYALARRRLAEVEPGFPPNTPGAGEPGGGTSFSNGSITARLADRRHTELDKARYIDTAPTTIADLVTGIARPLNIPRPAPSNSPRHLLNLLVWSRWATRRLLDHPDIVRDRDLERLHADVVNLHRVVTTWGVEPTVPATTATNQLADDPTGLWCRNCLNIGVREPRWRGYLDRWCYEFLRGEGFLPPAALLTIRQSKPRVTQRDVEPFVRAHREQNKKRRRKTG